MFPTGFYQGQNNDMVNDFDVENVMCAIQRCDIRAEYECHDCLKRYCDDHYRIHFHFDDRSNRELR